MASSPPPTPETTEAALRVCACLNLRRAARAATRFYDDALEPSGLRSPQFVILATVHANGAQSIQQLARDLGVERSAAARRLNPLRDKGLLQVTPNASGRGLRVRLTPKGRRALAKAVPLWAKAQQAVEQAVGERDWADALDALGKIPDAP